MQEVGGSIPPGSTIPARSTGRKRAEFLLKRRFSLLEALTSSTILGQDAGG
jgi:hypothetical protein